MDLAVREHGQCRHPPMFLRIPTALHSRPKGETSPNALRCLVTHDFDPHPHCAPLRRARSSADQLFELRLKLPYSVIRAAYTPPPNENAVESTRIIFDKIFDKNVRIDPGMRLALLEEPVSSPIALH